MNIAAALKHAVDRLKAMIGAYLVSKFRGLSGTAKQKAVTEDKDQVASLLAMAIETDDQRKEREERLRRLGKIRRGLET